MLPFLFRLPLYVMLPSGARCQIEFPTLSAILFSNGADGETRREAEGKAKHWEISHRSVASQLIHFSVAFTRKNRRSNFIDLV